MNIYDLKVINCHKCGKYIGEIRYDAEITTPLCGTCISLIPKIVEIPEYAASKYHKYLVNAISA